MEELRSLSSLAQIADVIARNPAQCGQTKIVAIDGPSGSGKTTLAAALADYLGGVSIIHMDQIYEGWDKALDPVLGQRLHEWIVQPISDGLPAVYLEFDWAQNSYGDWVSVPAGPMIILEGVGSGFKDVADFISTLIWVEAPNSDLLQRVLDRDGEGIRQEMLAWHPREHSYFATHDVKARSQLQVVGED